MRFRLSSSARWIKHTLRSSLRFSRTPPHGSGVQVPLRLLMALMLVACTEPSGVTEPQGPPPGGGGGGGGGGGSVQVSPVGGTNQAGTVGEALPLPMEVSVTDSTGTPLAGISVLWDVLQGNGAVSPDSTATDANGEAMASFTLGTGAGTQQAVARVAGDSTVFEATAAPDVPESIDVSPASLTVEIGGASQLVADVRDQHGNTASGSVSWSSSDTGVATVDGAGVLLGNAVGAATITAALGGVQDQAQVQVVEPAPVQSISVTPSSATMAGVNSTRQFEATARDSLGNTVPGSAVLWTSTDEGVVTVNASGLATARGLGTAAIIASAVCCGSPADTGDVVVNPPPPPPSGNFANMPAGWEVINDNPWDKIPRWWLDTRPWPGSEGGFPNGWSKIISAGPDGGPVGEGAVVQLSDAPDGDPNVFRITYNPGHPGGEDAYGVYYPMESNASSSVYFAIWMRFGEAGDTTSFKRHGNGMKMFSFDGDGDRVNMGWSDLDFEHGGGPCPDAFSMAYPGGGEDDWTSAFPGYTGRFPSCLPSWGHHQFGMYGHPNSGNHPSVKIIVGEWVLLELLIEDSPGRVRWWWNGTLAADFTGGSITAGPFRELLIDGTWGGGNSDVPAPQHWYVARTVVAIP